MIWFFQYDFLATKANNHKIKQDNRGLHIPRPDFGPSHSGSRTWPHGKLFHFFSIQTVCNVFLKYIVKSKRCQNF